MSAAAFTLAAILCAAFGGPLWASILLGAIAFLMIALEVAD